MLQLALEIVAWLAAAALLGFGVAWLLRGVDIAELKAQVQGLETDLVLRDRDLGEARRALGRAPSSDGRPAAAPAASPVAAPAGVAASDWDDLKRIRGVGPVLEQRLRQLGVHRFRQVAQWTDVDIEFFDRHLQTIRGRIRRENWVGSAAREHLRQYGESLATAPRTQPVGEAFRD